MEPVRSPRNQRVAAAARLRRARTRRAANSTLLEGPNLIGAAAAAGAEIGPVFALQDDRGTMRVAEEAGYEVVVVTQVVLDRLAPTQHPRGPVAVMRVPASVEIHNRNASVLWGVRDPGNVGTLIRAAAAFGFGIVIGPDSADPWNPKVLRAAAGAHFLVPIETDVSDLRRLQARGFHTVGSVVEGGVAPSDVRGDGPWALVVGDEARGLPEELAESCETQVTIPMSAGLESLNAAVAGSILMYELAKRSGRPIAPPD
ncbi:MAG TPA: RNA methyltransferase [Acidimicrobiia bacterium]|nr:RNA methyltransferase [Acidimicrobiia bacterium]